MLSDTWDLLGIILSMCAHDVDLLHPPSFSAWIVLDVSCLI
jgi:hypothetical protein